MLARRAFRTTSSVMASAVGAGSSASATIEALRFDNQTLKQLPVEKDGKTGQRQVKNACFSRVMPTPVDKPELVVASSDALALLGLATGEAARADLAEYFSGNKLIPGSEPAAHCYCGHQFGHFSGQLGDGATMYLGECINEQGHRWELQFKGAGKTPYSRTADGRKVLRSSMREFLASEAHHALGIPTTRAGTVVTSASTVIRDIYYSGNPIMEKATIITRIAPTFLRFGSFQIANGEDPVTGRSGPSSGNLEIIKTLADFTIKQYFPHIQAQHGADTPAAFRARVLAWFSEVCRRTARLVASWQCFGWCHGVLNTDNMSILGLTLDYGPYGWMEKYDPGYVCNASDDGARYSYDAQPSICRWNCGKLAEALAPMLHEYGRDASTGAGAGGSAEDDSPIYEGSSLTAGMMEPFRPALTGFLDEYRTAYNDGMRRKLGLGLRDQVQGKLPALPLWRDWSTPTESANTTHGYGGMSSDDEGMVKDLFTLMAQTGADFTNTFRALADVDIAGADKGAAGSAADPVLEYIVSQCASVEESAQSLKPTVPMARLQQLLPMARMFPGMEDQVPLIEAEIAKYAAYEKAKRRSESDKRGEDVTAWSAWLERYRGRIAQESSECTAAGISIREANKVRQEMTQKANPRIILRNWVAHIAIKAAEGGDYSVVRALYDRLRDPCDLNHASDSLTGQQQQQGGANASAAAAVDAALATAHVQAPNMAEEGSSRLIGQAEDEQAGTSGSASAAAAAMNLEQLLAETANRVFKGASCGGDGSAGQPSQSSDRARLDLTCRPPPWALDLKVT